jgi:hypothetical protein
MSSLPEPPLVCCTLFLIRQFRSLSGSIPHNKRRPKVFSYQFATDDAYQRVLKDRARERAKFSRDSLRFIKGNTPLGVILPSQCVICLSAGE